MKKLLLSVGMLSLIYSANSQSQRMVLVEHFTNASCGPCAAYNPGVQAILEDAQNEDRLISIKYQWYFPGFDPMHNHNPDEANDRTSFYGINGVPTTNLDGNFWQDNASLFTQNLVNTRKNTASPVDINLTHTISDDESTMDVSMEIIVNEALTTTDLRAHIVIVEEEITFGSAPGSNGETEFYNVMKKMLPNDLGTSLGTSYSAGDTILIEESWTLANVYDNLTLKAVAFLQDNDDKEIFQAAVSELQAPKVKYDASSVNISTLPKVCSESIGAELTVQNRGYEEITKLEIEYTINDSTHSLNWTGSILPVDKETISIPVSNYNSNTLNSFEAEILSINDSIDVDLSDNTTSSSFRYSSDEHHYTDLIFELTPDNYPQEITWELLDKDGNQLYSGGPYSSSSTTTHTFELLDLECYVFIINDSYGDGLTDGGNGGYRIYYNENDSTEVNIYSGKSYGDQDVNAFSLNVANRPLSINNDGFNNFVSVYPNPANDVVNINIENNKSIANVEIVDVTGKTIKTVELTGSKTSINTLGLDKGVYFINVSTSDNSYTEKLILK